MSDPSPSASDEATGAAVEAVLRARRTSLLIDPDAAVAHDLVDRLIDLAALAPNHKRTWPWRFTVLTGAGRVRFGESLAEAADAGGFEPAKVAKLRTKYLRSPVVLLAWVVADAADRVRRREDRDAVAAAVENLLVAATALGLASHWASIPDDLHDAARAVAGVGPDHDLVALVYLGWPTGVPSAPERPAVEVRWIDG